MAQRKYIHFPVDRSIIFLGMSVFFFLDNEYLLSQENPDNQSKKKFTLNGSISLNVIGYSVSGIPARAEPFSAILSANVTANIFGIEMPLFFAISNRQESYAQPFNEFGISPRWKWITLHAGYRNITFSNFTLAGHTFFGAGIELNPSIFRFGFIYGRFDRKTTESPLYKNDSLPHFARRGFAVKLGVGTDNNFFDLIFLRIRDDSTTLHQADTGAIRMPEQNVVAGFNSRFTFFKKLTWETEAALSLYTTNMSAEISKDIENNSTLHSLNRFLVVNQSSEYYYAIRSSLRYKAKYWSLKLEYKRIEPNYRSMGAYFFNNDIENLTLSPSFSLFKRKFYMNGSIGVQQDNLRKTKRATSQRIIGNAGISLNPSQNFGIDANYSNYSLGQKAGRLALNDTNKVIQTSQNISLAPRIMFFNPKRSHMILLIYNFANFIDRNKFTSEYTRFNAYIGQANYILGLLQSRWSFTFGLTYTLTSNYLMKNTNWGGSFGISKSLLKDKLSLNLNNSLMRTDAGNAAGYIFNSNLISSYRITKHHSLRLNIYFTGNYMDPGSLGKSFNEMKGDLSYVFTF